MTNPFLLAAETGASEGPTLLHMLATLLAIILVARLAAEFAERVGIPTVLAEIAAGILLGGSVLGIVETSETLHLLAEIGAILLLFEVGLHMDLGDLMRVGKNATRVALIGIVAPAAATYPLAIALGVDRDPAIFLAAAVTATSVGITARVFADMKVLATPESRTVLGAAVIDDILGLLILTFVTQSLGTTGGGRSIGVTIALAIVFLLFGGATSVLIAPRFFDFVSRWGRTDGALVVGTFGFALAIAAAGAWAGLAPLVGGFLAGVAAARSERSADFQRRLAPIGQLIIPIFFVAVGLEVDVTVFANMDAVVLALAISAVAVVTKLASGLGATGDVDKPVIGLGMVPRGEVGLIFATLGLASGVLDTENHASLVLVVLITTIVTPPLLRWRISKRKVGTEVADQTTVPAASCLKEDGRMLELIGPPTDEDALVVVLQAARGLADRRPGTKLVEWLRNGPLKDPSWDQSSRDALYDLLEHGRDRSFRMLEATGVFAQLFPVIAEEPAHAVDPYGLEPEAEATWDGVLSLQAVLRDSDDPATIAYRTLEQRHTVLLAALARGAFAGSDAGEKAKHLAADIGLPLEQAEEVGELVAERRLLPAAALEPDMGVERQVLELATHLGSQRLATGLYVLAVAENRQDREIRARVDELFGLLDSALTHEGSGVDLIEARRSAVRSSIKDLPSEIVSDRLAEATRRYLLTYSPEVVAQHIRMLDPLPRPDELRLYIEDDGREKARIHVVIRDRLGALAAIAHAINSTGRKIHDASAAVWPSGIAILVFLVESPNRMDPETLQPKLAEALRSASALPALSKVEGHASIDNHASPWYSIVEIRAKDREGLLASVASAIAAAGGEIVYATVTTTGETAVDRFFVVGRGGGKLTPRDERAIRSALDGKRPMRVPGGR